MAHAIRSRSADMRALAARMLVTLLLVTSQARADDRDFVVVPFECAGAWTVVSGPRTPAARDAMLSLAACVQDASLTQIDREDRVAERVDELHGALEPALRLYMAVFETAPDEVKVRAAYAIALAETSLMTRARLSLTTPELRDTLDEVLDAHARVAYMILDGLDRLAEAEPTLFEDLVNRRIARSAHELARVLRLRWQDERYRVRELRASVFRHAP